MYAKKIKYKDFDDNEREDTFLFHLKKSEVMEWMMQEGDYTLDKVILKIIQKKNGKELMASFKDLILRSYGEKSVDGKRFIKTPQMREEFEQTEAYSVLFMELISDSEKALEFFNGILPEDMVKEMAKALEENPEGIPEELRDYLPDKSKFVK